jgi:DNA-binding transcriptional MocR family regulator
VARAYGTLSESGVLEAVVGRGTFMARRPPTHHQKEAAASIEAGLQPAGADDSHVVNMASPHLPAVGQDVLIRQLLADIATRPPSGIMNYPDRQAAGPARAAVVHWLSGTPLGELREADIILSHGGQNGLLFVLQAILQGPSPTILIEELAYPGFRRAAELLRADVVPVEMDRHGLCPDALAAAAERHKPQVLCCSPEVHNPTGCLTPPERRAEIAEIARRFDFQIVEDDCYRMQAERGPTFRLLAPERGWYVSSLAKTLTPALRIGFAIAAQGRTADLRRVAEHNCFGLATPLTDLTAALLTHPKINALADAALAVLNDYLHCAVECLGDYDVTWRKDVPFLWLHLPVGWRAGAFCRAAEAESVQVRSAEEFSVRDARVPHAIRIAVNASVSRASFEAAVQRLRRLLDNPPDQIAV